MPGREGLRDTSLRIFQFPLGKHTYLSEVSIKGFKATELHPVTMLF